AVWALARRIASPAAAALGGSLFAVFPASAECVGWIAGRNDILAGLFSAVAGAVFLAGLGFRGGEKPRGAVSMGRIAGSALLFLLALLSKESAIGLAPFLVAAVWVAGV